MSKSKFTLIYYYVPEDKDDPEFPNAFGVNMAIDDIRLPDIRSMFPLEGEYIFRFKYKANNTVVWMDINEESKIPFYNSKIIMKATRISWTSQRRPVQNTKREESKPVTEATYGSLSESQKAKQAQKEEQYQKAEPKKQAPEQQKQNYYNDHDFDLLAGDHKSHGNQKSSPQQNSNHHHDLLDYDHSNQNSNNNSQKSGDNKHGNLLDFDGVF